MSRYRKTMLEALQQVYKVKEQDEKDHEVSMARGELEAIADKATQLASMLQSKSDEGNPLEAWVQSKITKAKDYITSVSDYLTYNPDMKQNEEVDLDEAEDYGLKGTITDKQLQNIKSVWSNKTKKDITPGVKAMLAKLDSPTRLAIKMAKINVLSDLVEEINEAFSSSLKQKAKEIAKKFADNMTKAVDEIEKLAKGLSDEPEVYKVIKQYNEDTQRPAPNNPNPKELDEAQSHTVRYTDPLNKKRFAIPYKTHADAEKKMAQLKKDGVKEIEITMDTLKPGMKFKEFKEELEEGIMKDIYTMDKEGASADDIAKRLKINVSTVKKILGEAIEEPKEAIEEPEKENNQQSEIISKNKEIETLKGQVSLLKQKIENEKNKAIKPQPNPETGEVPLTIGIAHKIIRDNQKKEAEEKKQKENSDKLQQLNVEETRLEAFTRRFLSDLSESAASEKAKSMGLKHMSFGRYGTGGKVTHRSVGGTLQTVGKGDTGTSDKPKSSSKDTSKSSSKEKSTSKSFGKGGTSSITLGDLDGSDKDLQNLIKKSGLKMKSKEGEQGDDITLSGNSKDIEKVLDTMYGDDWKDMYQNKGGKYVEKENSLENYKKSNAYEMLAGRASIINADNITQTDFGLEKDFDRLRSTLKGYGDNETVSLMDKFKDAIEEDDSESYPALQQDLMYALEDGDAKKNPVYDQLKKVDDANNIFGQQKYSSGDVKSYLKDTSVMINQLDKLLKMSITEPMTQQDTVRQVRDDTVQRFAQASEKMIDGLRSVAKGVKSIDQVKILANLENELKDLQPEEGIHQNYALPKRVKDGIFLIKDYMRMYKRVESGSPDESDRRQLRDPLFGTITTAGKKKKNIKITKDYFKEEYLQELEEVTQKEKLDEKVASSIIRDLQKSYGDLKGKTISPEMANKISKHLDQPSYDLDTLRQLVKANIPFISTLARNKIYKKTGKFEEKRLQIESLVALKNKAEKTGMPYNILKQVYDRGMAAWKSGHRPGAGQQQWALARVNSFVTKSSGTWGGADKDLAAKVKGEK